MPFPTIDEVEHAIQFLGTAGLVRYSLQLTDEGRSVCRRTESQDVFSTLERLHRLLKILPEIAEAPNGNRSSTVPLSQRSGALWVTDG
jgi:hypothetical protein